MRKRKDGQLEAPGGLTVTLDAPSRLMSESRSLPPDLSASAAARGALERISCGLGDGVFSRSTVVVTELVTNSVKHGGLSADQRIELKLAVQPACLRIEVSDAGHGFEWNGVTPAPRQESGWGLLLVDGLADHWGVDCSHHTRVWCEFDHSSN